MRDPKPTVDRSHARQASIRTAWSKCARRAPVLAHRGERHCTIVEVVVIGLLLVGIAIGVVRFLGAKVHESANRICFAMESCTSRPTTFANGLEDPTDQPPPTSQVAEQQAQHSKGEERVRRE